MDSIKLHMKQVSRGRFTGEEVYRHCLWVRVEGREESEEKRDWPFIRGCSTCTGGGCATQVDSGNVSPLGS